MMPRRRSAGMRGRGSAYSGSLPSHLLVWWEPSLPYGPITRPQLLAFPASHCRTNEMSAVRGPGLDDDSRAAYLFQCVDTDLRAVTLDAEGANLPVDQCDAGWR